MENKIKAVIFDIDGTLLPDLSWTRLTEDLGVSAEEELRLISDLRNGKITYKQAKEELIALWKSSGQATQEVFRKIFSSWHLKQDTRSIFDYLRSKGYKIGILTGSMDLFAEIVSQKVGADFWYANTTLLWDDAGNLKDFIYYLKQGEKKLEQFMEFCSVNGIHPEECATVGDGENDVEIFKKSGHGIAVESPSSFHLDQFAWKKIKDLKEIEQML